MCGICGEIVFSSGNASIENVERMTKALRSRGPDAQGLYSCGTQALGHRRLKIIDLSENARQPMVDSHLGLSIVYNGAIYNYKRLRQNLKSKGYNFFSNGDTEVILKAYHAWGEECVKQFNGMFAFCILHHDSGKTFLARDRLGIKPLYYANSDARLRFASSLPALLETDGIDTRIDSVALNHYMTFHSVVPAPYTIVRGVRKLPPATTLTVYPNGTTNEVPYWQLAYNQGVDDTLKSAAEWQEHLLYMLRKAVSRRLTADVPVGVLLSGGVDSSLVVGLLSELGQEGLHTFSIGFESVGGEKGDEFQYSDLIADHFGTKHHRIEMTTDRTLPALQKCLQAMSEPMVSHDCVGFYLLSEAVSRHVKVVQSGQGADEVFGGYYWYPPLIDSDEPVADYADEFFDRDYAEYARAVNRRFVEQDHSLEFVKAHFNNPGAQQSVDKALRLDTTVMLVEDPVKRVDNMTMAWGLEARVPFLDHEVVELAARIPAEYKIKNGGKHILKQAARDVIPDAVIDRKKGYFPVPALKYLEGEYLDFVQDILDSEKARGRKLFNTGYVKELLKDPSAYITPLQGSKLWQIAVLEYWLSENRL
jgi:asparagine synthase (glutamine-hydrolysing)